MTTTSANQPYRAYPYPGVGIAALASVLTAVARFCTSRTRRARPARTAPAE